MHAHSRGDVNAAYRIRQHEWSQVARGDPQWPQAFYPTENAPYDLKDGDPIVGICTYHNDGDKYVYAGSTHNDEMCNVYLMYYTDSPNDVTMEVCSGNTFPQLESVIPEEASIKPSALPSFNTAINNNNNNNNANPMSHHDMEGSKLHPPSSDSKNKPGDGQLENSLAYLLSQAGLEDYSDEVESARSKGRSRSDVAVLGGAGTYSGSSDDLQSLLDPSLIDLDNSNDDYTDPTSSLLFSKIAAKINNKNGGTGKKPSLTNRIKTQLNNLLPQTVSSNKNQT